MNKASSLRVEGLAPLWRPQATSSGRVCHLLGWWPPSFRLVARQSSGWLHATSCLGWPPAGKQCLVWPRLVESSLVQSSLSSDPPPPICVGEFRKQAQPWRPLPSHEHTGFLRCFTRDPACAWKHRGKFRCLLANHVETKVVRPNLHEFCRIVLGSGKISTRESYPSTFNSVQRPQALAQQKRKTTNAYAPADTPSTPLVVPSDDSRASLGSSPPWAPKTP